MNIYTHALEVKNSMASKLVGLSSVKDKANFI